MTDRQTTTPAIAALNRALALEAAIDEAYTEYTEATGEHRYAFAVDVIVLLGDRVGLLEPARTAAFLRALADALASTRSSDYQAARGDLDARAAHLLDALGAGHRRRP